MPFDMNQLFENPAFAFGSSLVANGRGPNAMSNAFGIAQKINDFKQQRDFQNTTLQQNAGRYAQNAKYEDAQIEQQKAETAFKNSQNARLEKQSQLEYAQKARAMMMQENVMRALAQRFHMDPTLFATPPGSMTGALPQDGQPAPEAPGMQQAGAQGMNAMQNMPQGSNLSDPRIQGMVGGAQMAPATPAPMEAAPPQQMPNFDPNGPRDPAGPMNNGSYGAPGMQAPGRPMLRASGQMMAPAIFGQESGNRDNIGVSVNGARGPGQMLPATFQRFAKPGERIDNPSDNRNVSTRYLDYLAAKAAGDPAKIAAGYFSGEGNMGTGSQPFKRDVADGNGKHVSSYVQDILNKLGPSAPTGYTQRILAGLDQPPARQSGMQGPPSNPQDMDLAQIGAMMSLAGMKGGDGLLKLAELQKPQSVAAGSYQRDPTTGQTTFVGDPYREQSLANDQTRIGIENQRLGVDQQRAQNDTIRTGVDVQKGARDIAKQDTEMARARAGDTNHLNAINTNMDRMGNAASSLLKDPGLKYNTGLYGALHIDALPGTAARDARARLETLKNKLVVDTMTALKEASATGSTGFGQLSEKEGERLETMIANLDHAQSEDAMRKQLQTIVQYSKDAKASARGRYNNIYGHDAQQPAAPTAAPKLPAGWSVTVD